jgi:hypothetical protein
MKKDLSPLIVRYFMTSFKEKARRMAMPPTEKPRRLGTILLDISAILGVL